MDFEKITDNEKEWDCCYMCGEAKLTMNEIKQYSQRKGRNKIYNIRKICDSCMIPFVKQYIGIGIHL